MSVIFLGHSSPKSGPNNRGERPGQKNRHDDVIPLVPVAQKVDKTLKTGSISIDWIALLISLYLSILYWLVFFSAGSKIVFFPDRSMMLSRVNNWARLYIDLMNRGEFLIQFSFFYSKSVKKKRSRVHI